MKQRIKEKRPFDFTARQQRQNILHGISGDQNKYKQQYRVEGGEEKLPQQVALEKVGHKFIVWRERERREGKYNLAENLID